MPYNPPVPPYYHNPFQQPLPSPYYPNPNGNPSIPFSSPSKFLPNNIPPFNSNLQSKPNSKNPVLLQSNNSADKTVPVTEPEQNTSSATGLAGKDVEPVSVGVSNDSNVSSPGVYSSPQSVQQQYYGNPYQQNFQNMREFGNKNYYQQRQRNISYNNPSSNEYKNTICPYPLTCNRNKCPYAHHRLFVLFLN
jgi:hypothetical protein